MQKIVVDKKQSFVATTHSRFLGGGVANGGDVARIGGAELN